MVIKVRKIGSADDQGVVCQAFVVLCLVASGAPLASRFFVVPLYAEVSMPTFHPFAIMPSVLSAAVFLTLAGPTHAVDAKAAESLARRNNCLKCHSVDKKKEAPPWKEVAAKMKGKPDAQATLIKHITSGQKVKTTDGTEEDHPIIKTKNMDEIKNLADWILSL